MTVGGMYESYRIRFSQGFAATQKAAVRPPRRTRDGGKRFRQEKRGATARGLRSGLRESKVNKRKVSAKEVLQDLRAGESNAALMTKYGITAQGLESLLNKLAQRNLISPEERRRRVPPESRPPAWTCPACGTAHDRSYAECPHCGVIVSKFEEHRRKPAPADTPDEKPPSDLPPESSGSVTIVVDPLSREIEAEHASLSNGLRTSVYPGVSFSVNALYRLSWACLAAGALVGVVGSAALIAQDSLLWGVFALLVGFAIGGISWIGLRSSGLGLLILSDISLALMKNNCRLEGLSPKTDREEDIQGAGRP